MSDLNPEGSRHHPRRFSVRGSLAAVRFTRVFGVLPLVAFRGVAGGMPVLIGLYIGHRWGLVPLGSYAFASSFAAVGLVVTDWGCARWLPRELVWQRSGHDATTIYAANGLRLTIACAYLSLTALLWIFGAMAADSALYAAELGVLYFIAVLSTNGVSDRVVTGDVFPIAWAVGSGLIVFAGVAVIVERVVGGPHALVAAYVTGKIVEACLLIAGRTSSLRLRIEKMANVAVTLWPFGIQAILGVVYARLAIFVAGHLRPLSDVGILGAASALQNVVLLLPTSAALLVYPGLTEAAARSDRARMEAITFRYAAGSAIAVTAGVAVLVAFRPTICRALHVPPDDANLLTGFVAVAFLTIVSTIAGVWLQALGRERSAARLSWITLGLALLYQYTLIRVYGLPGALFAVAAAEFTSMIIFGISAWRSAETRFAKRS